MSKKNYTPLVTRGGSPIVPGAGSEVDFGLQNSDVLEQNLRENAAPNSEGNYHKMATTNAARRHHRSSRGSQDYVQVGQGEDRAGAESTSSGTSSGTSSEDEGQSTRATRQKTAAVYGRDLPSACICDTHDCNCGCCSTCLGAGAETFMHKVRKLSGKTIDKHGNIVDESQGGKVYGRVQGNVKKLSEKTIDDKGQLVKRNGKVVGSVHSTGQILDPQGKPVGQITEVGKVSLVDILKAAAKAPSMAAADCACTTCCGQARRPDVGMRYAARQPQHLMVSPGSKITIHIESH